MAHHYSTFLTPTTNNFTAHTYFNEEKERGDNVFIKLYTVYSLLYTISIAFYLYASQHFNQRHLKQFENNERDNRPEVVVLPTSSVVEENKKEENISTQQFLRAKSFNAFLDGQISSEAS